LVLVFTGFGIWGAISDLAIVSTIDHPNAEHLDQQTLNQLVAAGDVSEAFEEAFEHGDELFETTFNYVDGVGAHVGEGQRFTRIPRADLMGPGEWGKHFPARVTGPNAQSCNSCHNLPTDDGAGGSSSNVHRDPQHSGVLNKFIQRNTPHTFGAGAVQRLAEEMTDVLRSIRDSAQTQACNSGGSVTKSLTANGISYGSITVKRTATNPCKVTFITTAIKGIDPDLVVRPYQWKGSVAFLRDFNRGAAHNELGMQASEIAGEGVDGDDDGVANELTVGDLTALSVYLAAQPRPTSLIELHVQRLIPPLSQNDINSIARGALRFAQVGCANCHMPVLKINNPVFSEPSQNAIYRDAVLTHGTALRAMSDVIGPRDPLVAAPTTTIAGLDPALPVSFDLTKDQPDNQIKDGSGNVIYRLGSFRKDSSGKTLVELFGDLKRHDMGSALAEDIDEVGTGASVFLTENLWGVGSTAPYLHDGRATTLSEAIIAHGGEGLTSKNAFLGLSDAQKQDLVNFLNNLVLFKLPEED
jgi:hypothetical protein